MASVLDGLLVSLFPVCMVSPSLFIILSRILIPAVIYSLVLNRDAQFLTYMSMCVRRCVCESDEALWLESEPWLGGEWAREMVVMLLAVHCLVTVSSRACITMMKSVGARLSPCLTPVVYGYSLCSLPIVNLTKLFVYNFLITVMIDVGMPKLARIR